MIVSPEIYDQIYTTEKPIIILTGSRAGGKSFQVSLACARLSYERDQVMLFCRYIMDSAKDSIIPEFQEKLELDGLVNDFKILAKDVTNIRSKGIIKFRGIKTASGNQTAKLKGTKGLSTVIIDEAEEWRSKEDFMKLLDSVRSKKCKNRVFIVMNPTDVDHFVYQEFFKDSHKYVEFDGVPVQISTHEDVCHIHTTWLDNLENLSPEFVKRARKKQAEYHASDDPNKDLGYYARSLIGRWADRKQGVVFENWSIGEFPDRIDYCYGLDFGWHPDPLAMVKVGVDKRNKKIYVKQELYSTKLSDENILEYLKANIMRRDLIVCDTNDGKTADRIRNERFNIHKAIKEKIATDISEMADYEIIVDPGSTNVIYELNNYTWNDKKASIPNGDHNHACDAIRYAFRRLMSPTISASWG